MALTQEQENTIIQALGTTGIKAPETTGIQALETTTGLTAKLAATQEELEKLFDLNNFNAIHDSIVFITEFEDPRFKETSAGQYVLHTIDEIETLKYSTTHGEL